MDEWLESYLAEHEVKWEQVRGLDGTVPPPKKIKAERPLAGRLLEIYEAVKDLGWISGSFATWTAKLGAPEPGDIDIFCKYDDDYEADETNHEQIVAALEKIGFQAAKLTDFSETMVDQRGETNLFVQVVLSRPLVDILGETEADHLKRFGDTPAKLVENFDLSVAQAVIVAPDTVWVTGDWIVDMAQNTATVVNLKTPLRTAERLGKYAAKGYFVPRYEYVKLFNAWGEMTDEERGAQYYG